MKLKNARRVVGSFAGAVAVAVAAAAGGRGRAAGGCLRACVCVGGMAGRSQGGAGALPQF
ncbi:uncharacterized protein K452DRAFT_289467 [Aplosporella prunicola CBS 121167]|uniref:Uncharacterized protein n=1 Tax=Aplosporella prunicola CBS 121167 TaxID=1176127 RepID=A0A6A6BA12_9PEZI|nr:uncharacterized protein K452DRAFT_289467 [Aplosporella prunicola CBS 121167]KAF2140074.1 hypothetical protein K452DRAFT_289467 [Aplosporella prunicola CBS 121167]